MAHTLGHRAGGPTGVSSAAVTTSPARSPPCSPGGPRRGCAATWSPTCVLDAVIGEDATHVVAGLPDEDGPSPCWPALGRAAGRAAPSGRAAPLPAAGDPLGLGGPAAFNAAALEAGEAVVVRRQRRSAWCRRASGPPSSGRPSRRDRGQLPDVGEADRELRAALLESAEPAGRARRGALAPRGRRRADGPAPPAPGRTRPPGIPGRCLDLAGRGLQAMTIVDLALADDGGAISALEIEHRRAALVPLDRAGRRALVAACSPEVLAAG